MLILISTSSLPNAGDLFATSAWGKVFSSYLEYKWATSSNLSKLDKDHQARATWPLRLTYKGLHHYKLGAIWSIQCTSHISENLWTRFCRPGIKFTICHLDDVLIQGVRLWIWGRVLGISRTQYHHPTLLSFTGPSFFLDTGLTTTTFISSCRGQNDVIMKLSVPQVSRSWSPIWDFAIKDYMAYFCQTWSLSTSSRRGIGGGQRNERAMKSSLIFRAVAQ